MVIYPPDFPALFNEPDNEYPAALSTRFTSWKTAMTSSRKQMTALYALYLGRTDLDCSRCKELAELLYPRRWYSCRQLLNKGTGRFKTVKCL
jgi:hypothetical protein